MKAFLSFDILLNTFLYIGHTWICGSLGPRYGRKPGLEWSSLLISSETEDGKVSHHKQS